MTRIVIFAKAPQPGSVKTRLIPALGAVGAATLARQFLVHTVQQALAANVGKVELCMSPAPLDPAWHDVALPSDVVLTGQGEGDLGERMARAVSRNTQSTESVSGPVMLIGTDCPALTAPLLKQAAQQLQTHDAVLLPAHDGGYVLLGLKSPSPELFEHMAWSTSVVSAETLRRMAALNMRVWQGSTLHDIDEPADLQHLPDLFLEPLPSNQATT
ncbi:MAG: TIGR04282 family arsenosugar biosynthesis glycosyltransferase [Polaromonas sp.]